MWGTLEGIVLPTLRSVGQLLHDRPVIAATYFVLALATLALMGRDLWRGEARKAYWWTVAFVLVNTVFSWGDDTYSHIYRIAALTEEYGAGKPGMLLTNPTTGQVLPVFVFYSVLPYLPGTFLNLLGIPAWIAFKIVLLGQYLIFAFGLQALLDRSRPADAPTSRVTADFAIGTMFLLANYVYTLWPGRAALAELWVYSLVPWVAAAILRPDGGRALVGLFFVQAVSHPIVLAQALICEIAVPYCMGRMAPREFIRRWLGPLAVALLLAAPFWAAQFLWKDLILGPAGLPLPFENSFRTVTDLVHGRDFRSIGPFMPIALVVAVVAARGRLDFRFWIATALTVVLLLVQWIGVRDLVSRIPVLNLSVFVWRLMLPAAFLAFGAVLVGWRQLARPPLRLLSTLAFLAAIAMLWSSLLAKEKTLEIVDRAPNDRAALVDYNLGDGIFGIREFLPRYTRAPALCPPDGEIQRASYNDLRRGLVAQKAYVAVADAPFGFVDYSAPYGACRDDLVLGPLKPGETVRVSERIVNGLFFVRMAELAILAALALFLFLPRRRPA